MITLTKWEVDELTEALSARGRLWYRASTFHWIRHTHSNLNRYALRLQNGLPHEMYLLEIEVLSVESAFTAESEVQKLLRVFTSYSDRKDVEDMLRSVLDDSFEMSLRIAKVFCAPRESADNAHIIPVEPPTPQSVTPVVRSRYMKNLLKGRV